MYGLEYTDLGN